MTTDGIRRRDARQDRDPEVASGPWGVLHAVLAFALEVATLGAYWYIGSRAAPGFMGVAAGLVVAAVFVVVWSLFFAPRARRRLPWPLRPLAALALFVLAGALVLGFGQPAGAALIVAALLDTVLGYWLRRRV